MHQFDYSKYEEYTWDNEIVSYIAQIHEYRGKQELYRRQKPAELGRLVNIARIQSTESSNSIEGIVTTKPRLKSLVAEKTEPCNMDEEEILGYKQVLDLVNEEYESIPIKSNHILQLHGMMLKHTATNYGGKFKTTSNVIAKTYEDGHQEVIFRPLEPYETPEAVENLCAEFNQAMAEGKVDPLILIPLFILDFLCIHPFNDGNGRMSRLLTLLLMYRSGYMVGKYISIEKAIDDSRSVYYDVLYKSDQGWQDDSNDPIHFIKYMLGIILSCYRDFERRLTVSDKAEARNRDSSKTGAKSTSYDVVREYVIGTVGSFTKQMVLEHCPSHGSSSVESALKKLTEDGTLKRLGVGRSTRYVRKD